MTPAADSDSRFERAAHALWAGLAVLVLLRAVVTLLPTMWPWALNLQRFLPPLSGWTMWTLAAFPLVPTLARWSERWTGRAGERMATKPHIAYVSWAVVTAVILWFTPDRMQFVGDFYVRVGAVLGEIRTEFLFPQAFPLDLFLHHDVPIYLQKRFGIDVVLYERLTGIAGAAMMAMLSVAFVRTLELRRGAAFAAAMVVLLGGYLGLFTGYGKALRELCLVAGAVGVFGLRVVRGRGGWMPLGLAVAVGLLLHRSAAVFALPMLTAWVIAWRGGQVAWRRPAVLAGIAVPLGVLAVMLPRVVRTVTSTDAVHLAPAGGGLGAVLAKALEPIHLADALNVAVQMSPVVLVAPSLAVVLWGRLPRRELAFLLVFVTPLALSFLFVHPRQGVFRDWDVFAAAGVSLSMFTAWLIGLTLQATPRFAWLAMGVMFGVESVTAKFLMSNSRTETGFARIQAYLDESPAAQRESGERAYAYNFLGLRYSTLGRARLAATSHERAAELAPSPRLLYEWATAEADAGNFEKAREVLYRTIEKAEPLFDAWSSLAYISFRLGDVAEARRAAERALQLRPGDAAMTELMQSITQRESDD